MSSSTSTRLKAAVNSKPPSPPPAMPHRACLGEMTDREPSEDWDALSAAALGQRSPVIHEDGESLTAS